MKKYLKHMHVILLHVTLFVFSTAFSQGDEATGSNQSVSIDSLDAEEILALIAAADTEYVQDWADEVGFTVAHVDGPAPLIGISRDRLVAVLGEPDAVNDDGTEEWSIGLLHEMEMNPAPVLIFHFDDEGTVTDVYSRLGE